MAWNGDRGGVIKQESAKRQPFSNPTSLDIRSRRLMTLSRQLVPILAAVDKTRSARLFRKASVVLLHENDSLRDNQNRQDIWNFEKSLTDCVLLAIG